MKDIITEYIRKPSQITQYPQIKYEEEKSNAPSKNICEEEERSDEELIMTARRSHTCRKRL